MQQIVFSLAAGQTKVFDSAGGYFEIIDSTGTVTVAMTDSHGSRTKDGELMNVLSGTYLKQKFSRWEITDTSGAANTVTILYGFGDGGTRRSPGTVRVIDSSADKTNLGRQFFDGNAVPADATPKWGVLSLGANGKSVAVRKMYISSPAAGSVRIGRSTSLGTAQVGGFGGANKILFGAASTAQILAGSTAAANPTAGEVPGSAFYARISVGAALPLILDMSLSPFVLSGTQTLLVMDGDTGNRQINCTFDYEELN